MQTAAIFLDLGKWVERDHDKKQHWAIRKRVGGRISTVLSLFRSSSPVTVSTLPATDDLVRPSFARLGGQ